MIAALSAIYSKSNLPGASKLKEMFGGKIQQLLDNPQMMMKIIDALGFLKPNSGSGNISTPSKMDIAKIIAKLLAIFSSGKKSLNDSALQEVELSTLFGDLFTAIINTSDSLVMQIEE